MENKKPKVILLVAGEGKRLRPYTLDRPKCMVEIDGISLIDRQLSVLKAEGLNDIVMIGGYKADLLKREGIKLKINPRYYETNMVWTLFSAEEELEGDIIISYGDIVYSREVINTLLKSSADIAVVIDKQWERYWCSRSDNPLSDAETLKLDSDGRILEIGNKPKTIGEIDGQYIGMIKLSPSGVAKFKKVFHNNSVDFYKKYMTDFLQALISEGYPVFSVLIYGDWIEVDTVSDLFSSVNIGRVKNIEKTVSILSE